MGEYPNTVLEMSAAASQGSAASSSSGSAGLLPGDVPRPAADALRLRIATMIDGIDAAKVQEDFVCAHVLKIEKDKAMAELSVVLGQAHESQDLKFVALPTRKGDIWAKPGAQAYRTFLDFCQLQSRQSVVRIPVDASAKRVGQVLPCPIPGCRYVSKSNAEFERHQTHGHPSLPPALVKKGPVEKAPGLQGYTVKGLTPVLPPPKKKKTVAQPEDVAEAMESEAEQETEAAPAAASSEQPPELGGVGEPGGEPQAKKPRADLGFPRVVVNPNTGPGVKAKMPTQCTVPYIKIQEDLFSLGRYVATYDHKSASAAAAIPAEKVASLPRRLAGCTKQYRWGNVGADEATKRQHLEAVLRWAWEKHIHFFGGERPADTVVVEGDLLL